MDPVSHLLLARLVSHAPAAWLGTLLPDLPWYALYPTWLRAQGRLGTALKQGDWPTPPLRIRRWHYAAHSLLLFPLLPLMVCRRSRHGRQIALGWVLHILVDMPTHSRDRMAPRPLWPLSGWALDGLSWADLLAKSLARLIRLWIPH